ncbi:MAG TPA: protein YgfX [Casimicrobiaceae bacterium]
MKATPALRISLGPSRSASALLCIACLATAALVAWLPGAAALRGALVIGIGAHAILAMRHWATRSAPRAIIGVELDADRAVRLTERTGRRIEGMVQADSYVGALLTTLVVRPDGKRRLRTVAILPDMLPADDFRRLRLLLRLGHSPTTAPDS